MQLFRRTLWPASPQDESLQSPKGITTPFPIRAHMTICREALDQHAGIPSIFGEVVSTIHVFPLSMMETKRKYHHRWDLSFPSQPSIIEYDVPVWPLRRSIWYVLYTNQYIYIYMYVHMCASLTVNTLWQSNSQGGCCCILSAVSTLRQVVCGFHLTISVDHKLRLLRDLAEYFTARSYGTCHDYVWVQVWLRAGPAWERICRLRVYSHHKFDRLTFKLGEEDQRGIIKLYTLKRWDFFSRVEGKNQDPILNSASVSHGIPHIPNWGEGGRLRAPGRLKIGALFAGNLPAQFWYLCFKYFVWEIARSYWKNGLRSL